MVGHLLYWSTLYGIKTQRMQEEGFSKWLQYIGRGPFYTLPDNDLDKIGESVMEKYIFLDFDGVLNTERSIDTLNRLDNLPPSAFKDLAYEEESSRISKINSESCNRKKLKFWKSTILNDEAYSWSWNFTILRKKLEYNIGYYRFTQRYVGWEKDVDRMVLACRLMDIAQRESFKDVYVNIRNCERFKMKPSDFEDVQFMDMHKKDLRVEKAYQLLWTVLRQNVKKWWD